MWMFRREQKIFALPEKILALILVGVVALYLSGCAAKQPSGQAQTGVQQQAASPKAGESSQETWQKDWAALREAAEKEGEFVLNGQAAIPAAFFAALSKKLEVDGLKIKLYGTTMPSSELHQRFNAEWANNRNSIDVTMNGLGTLINTFKPLGALASLEEMFILPEVKDLKNWYGGKLPYVDNQKMILNPNSAVSYGVWVNTTQINPGELKSREDLLKPEYKGKIAMGDVRVNGPAHNWFAVAMETGSVDKDFFAKLQGQELTITPDSALLSNWVAQGKYPIVIGPPSSTMVSMSMQGLPIAPALAGMGAYMGGGGTMMAVISKAPHPNAAKLFLNWYLTKDVQAVITPILGAPSLRVDVPTTGVSPLAARKEGINYFKADSEDFNNRKPQYNKVSVEIFGSTGKEK